MEYAKIGLFAFGMYELVNMILDPSTPPKEGNQDWGQSLEPDRQNPGGGDPILPPNNPTDPTQSGDPLWWTTTDPFPTKPFCAINLGFREPTLSQVSNVYHGFPGIISWTPDMDAFTQETCLPVQEFNSAPPASVVAARKYTGYAPGTNLYYWKDVAAPSRMDFAETIWFDPNKQMCSTTDGKGGRISSACGNWMLLPVGSPNEWQQGN